MMIQSLELKNFRNYRKLKIEFSDGINILYGDNAQGKTNILEAIYLCATTKSHRGGKDRDIIQFGMDESHIRMHLMKKDINHQLDMHLKKNKTKGVAIDRIPIRRSVDLIGLVPIIFFSPEDLSIIKNGPGERRKFLDIELSQMNKMYVYHLSNYHKVLIQRNNLLKQILKKNSMDATLDTWDVQLVKYGSEIIKFRKDFIEELNDIIQDIHKNLTGKQEKIILKYEYNVDVKNFMKQIQKRRKSDIRATVTGAGPHRDDICFLINEVDIRKFGSQGQQRTAALSLKLAQIELVKRRMKEEPILLLDDVLSELDSHRKNYLLQTITNIQTIITCTGLDEFLERQMHIDRKFHIKAGTIIDEN